MSRLYQSAVVAVTFLAAITLSACGGGSTGSGGGGSGSTMSSSVVIDMSSGTAMLPGPVEDMDSTRRVAVAISDLLVRKALAQVAGVPIYFNGIKVGETDADGTFVQAVPPGPIEVCVVSPTVPGNCFNLNVQENQVVVVDGVDIVGDRIVYNDPKTESAFDNLAEFESGKTHKVYVCHKGRTLDVSKSSVGTSMSIKGHQTHGDKMGACDAFGDNPAELPEKDGNDGEAKVTICHKPDDKPKTITVSESAVPAHTGHGDTIGACG